MIWRPYEPLRDRAIRLIFEINDSKVPAGVKDLTAMAIVVCADFHGNDLAGRDVAERPDKVTNHLGHWVRRPPAAVCRALDERFA